MRRTVALAVVAAAVLLGCGRSEGTVGPNDWDLYAVSHDGRTLVVSTFFGGVASDCTRFERWEIGESDDEVEVQAMLWRRRSPSACTEEGVTEMLTIRLATPLGDRRLTGCGDAECGHVGESIGGWGQAEVAVDGEVVAVGNGDGLVLLDAASGAVRTRHDGVRLRPFTTDGVVVVENERAGTSAFDAVATARAEPLWTMPEQLLVAHDGLAVTCRTDGQDPDVVARDVESGEPVWSAAVPCPVEPVVAEGRLAGTGWTTDGEPHLIVVDLTDGDVRTDVVHRVGAGGVVLVGDRLVSVDPAGSTVWDLDGAPLAEGNATGHRMLGAADGLAIATVDARPSLVAIDPDRGQLVWRRRLAGEARFVASVDDDAVFAAEPDAGELHRLDLATGDPDWSAPVGRSQVVDVAVHGDTAYVATVTSVLAIDLATGEERWATTHLEADTPHEADAPSEASETP